MMIRLTCGVLVNGRTVVELNSVRQGDLRLLLLVLLLRSVPLAQTTRPVACLDRNNGLSVYQ
jgi:hypothetical protein